MTKFEDVKNISTEEYFNGNKFSIDAFNKKYSLTENETYVEAIKRVCDYIASAENSEELKTYWSERWFDEIYNDWWHPAGSIMQGSGNPRKISLSNCTTLSLGTGDDENEWDSLEGIIRGAAYSTAKTAAYRQGLGIDFSRIRPKDMSVFNSSNKSEGVLHWMRFIDNVAYYVGQKGRIPAMLFSISDSHPDVLDFIEVKKDFTKIQNANISIQLTDAFYEAVDKDTDWELKFKIPAIKKGDKIYVDAHIKTEEAKQDSDGRWYTRASVTKKAETVSTIIKARDMFNLIIKNMHKNAEPGIQNIDIARRFSNSDAVYDPEANYNSKIISTNASVPYETPILTSQGYKQIGTLLNKKIKVWNGKIFNEVLIEQTGKNKKIVNIELSDGRSLRCTDNHIWILSDGTEVEAKNLKIGSKLKKYTMPVIDFKNYLPYDAYTHGFFCGDGQKNGDTIKGDRVCVTFSKNIPSKFKVPFGVSIKERLAWLAGLLDAGGNIIKNKNSKSLALVSINLKFLKEIQLMLTTLSVQAKIKLMSRGSLKSLPDGKGGIKQYQCKDTYSLLINSTDTKKLVELGLKTNRLDLSNLNPNRDARHFVKIIKITDVGIEDKVYCFNEPNNHTGCFNGIITGQCSEQYLSRDGLCVLGSINAEKFSIDQEKFSKELSVIAESINRFLDNVNTKEYDDHKYATPLQGEGIKAMRRTGAGVTNLAGLLFKAGYPYASQKGIDLASKFVETYNLELYKSTIKLGKEKGSFESFDSEKIKKSEFIKKMIKYGLNFTHMRNVTVSSIAPAGTLSLMFRNMTMSSGIEPAFGIYYWKRTRITGRYKYYFCIPSAVRKKFEEHNIKLPMNTDTIEDTWDGKLGKEVAKIIDDNKHLVPFSGASDINPMEKLKFVSEIAKHIDSSVSVTFMLPEDSTEEDVKNFILEAHKNNLKSISTFPDRRMYGIVSTIPFKDLAFKLKEEGVTLHPQNFTEEELKTLSMGKSIVASYAPKRPKDLDAEIYAISVKGERFIIAIGLLNGAPYEMFGGAMNGFNLTSNKKGKITKLYKNKYKLTIDGGFEIEDFSAAFDPVEQVLFRLVSSNLRHGVPVKFVCEQLNKATEDMTSLARAAARVLKKYIKDGEVAHGIECPVCGSTEMIYQDGCVSCTCGFSKCD